MKLRSLLLAAASIAVLSLTAFADKEINLEGIKCVMNSKGAAKANNSLEYKGGKVFFCCENCPKGFAKKIRARDKLVVAKGNHQLIATGQATTVKCPFSGAAAKKATAITIAGAKIAFCCEKCQAKAKGMKGDEQLVALFGDKAFKKARFTVARAEEEFTSEGAEDPKKEADEDPEFTSEGAEDPKDEADKDPEFTSEGAEDPEEEADKDPEFTSEGAEDPAEEDDKESDLTSEGAEDPENDQ